MSTAAENEVRADLRDLVDRVCADFPGTYWRELDNSSSYPEEFVDALTSTGVLGALVPAEFGGLGLGVGDASVIVEQINRRGGNAAAVHAQLCTMSAAHADPIWENLPGFFQPNGVAADRRPARCCRFRPGQ